MSIENRFKDRYKTGNTPWDIGKPDFNLIDAVTRLPTPSCKVLEVGCGNGDNAIWLGQQNFVVTGCDVSEIAVKNAKEKAAQAGVQCTFLVAEFLDNEIDGLPFNFVFDRGCFHTFDADEERRQFSKNVAHHLEKGGLWLSLIGNADEQCEGSGPPRRTATDLVLAVEPYFEILSLSMGHFDSNKPDPPKAWVLLMQKRS